MNSLFNKKKLFGFEAIFPSKTAFQ